jgi:nitroreductase
MDVREALYTTRAMRRVRPDPIPEPVQARILDAAIRAPSGGNSQDWRFLLIDDPGIKAQLGPLYRDAIGRLWATFYRERLDAARAAPDDPQGASLLRVQASAQHLADHFETVPLFLAAFARGDPEQRVPHERHCDRRRLRGPAPACVPDRDHDGRDDQAGEQQPGQPAAGPPPAAAELYVLDGAALLVAAP